MNLYLLKQDVVTGYDTYGSMVVAAESEEDARTMHPEDKPDTKADLSWRVDFPSWPSVQDSHEIKVLHLGQTNEPRGVILASFNAG